MYARPPENISRPFQLHKSHSQVIHQDAVFFIEITDSGDPLKYILLMLYSNLRSDENCESQSFRPFLEGF